jgi:membrane protein
VNVPFLVWLWSFNIAILFGAEFNAELERGRAAAGGERPQQQRYPGPPRR